MMKRVRKVVALSLVTGSMFLVSCGENKNKEVDESMDHDMHQGEHMDHDMSEDDHNHKNMNNVNNSHNDDITAEFQDDQVTSLYEKYSKIKTALVDSNSERAKMSAEELLAVIEPDQAETMATAAEKIANSNDVQEQRQAFSQLTEAIEGRLREGIVSGEIYMQYCPMAFEGKGDFWFSNSKEIRNPYYGEKMLKCGKVEETIDQQTL